MTSPDDMQKEIQLAIMRQPSDTFRAVAGAYRKVVDAYERVAAAEGIERIRIKEEADMLTEAAGQASLALMGLKMQVVIGPGGAPVLIPVPLDAPDPETPPDLDALGG